MIGVTSKTNGGGGFQGAPPIDANVPRHKALGYWIGFLTALGVLFPSLGRGINLGIHNRLLGTLFLCLAASLAASVFRFRQGSYVKLLLVLSLFALTILYADSTQIDLLLRFGLDDDYEAVKLSYLFQAVIVPAFLLFVIYNGDTTPDRARGLIHGFIVVAVIGAVIVFQVRSLLFGTSFVEFAEFRELELFSTIGLSTILSIGFLSLFAIRREAVPVAVLAVAGTVLLYMVLMLSQRTHLVFLLLFLVLWLYRIRGPFWSSVLALPIVGMVVFGSRLDLEELLNDRVYGYWLQIVEGTILGPRIALLQPAIEGWIQQPFGRGLGAYAREFTPALYPHNLVVEALYEMGVLGGIVVALIMGYAFWRGLVPLMRAKPFPSPLTQVCAVCLLTVVHQMKSGSLDTATLMVFALFAVPPRTERLNEERLGNG